MLADRASVLENIEMSILRARLAKPIAHIGRILPVAALAIGMGLFMPTTAFAQHSGGGHSGGGGSHGGGAAVHGGGGGGHGGWHGGGRGGWGHGYGYGGFGWGGYYGGFYPGFYGGYYDGGYDPFWAYGADAYDDQLAYAPQAAPPQPYGPQQYGPEQQYYPENGANGLPTDNNRGFYTWQLGIEGGTCNRPQLEQIAGSVTGTNPESLRVGARLGGIAVMPVIGGRIGPRLNLADQACATEAMEHARLGVPVRWQTSSGIPVSIQVTRTSDSQQGGQCRDYEATAQFGTHTDRVSSTACKGQDGSWRVTR
jgi:surface antigen